MLNESERTPEQWAPEPSGAESPPSYGLWLIYLYLQPRRFFSFFIENHVPAVTLLCAWMMGVVSAHNRAERRLSTGQFPSLLVDSWPVYLGFIGALGVLSAALFFYIGGWWYWKRLKWSGATDPDKPVARRVYLYASTVATLPGVCSLAVDALNFPRPVDAMNSNAGWAEFLPIAFLLWSVVTSYVGVRTVFGVTGWRPLVWFLVLPAFVYSAAVVIVLVVALSGLYSPVPNTASPSRHEQDAVSFSHPGNWYIERHDPEYDPQWSILIAMPQDAHVELAVFRSDMSPVEEALLTGEDWQGTFDAVTLRRELSSWGARSGAGAEYTVEFDGDEFIAQVFVIQVEPGVMAQFCAFFREKDRAQLVPGFEQIGRSLRVDATQLSTPRPEDPQDSEGGVAEDE